MLGLAAEATPFAAPFLSTATAGPASDKINTLLRAVTQWEVALLPATGIVINLIDWSQIISAKGAIDNYLGDNSFGTTQGRRIWDLPIAVTPAMPQGKFMVGNLGLSAQIFDRLDADAVISSKDHDKSMKNMLTVRAEKHLALAVKRSAGIAYGSLRSAPSGT